MERRAPTIDWESEIERFLADGESTRNPRSETAIREIGGRRFHFKHSRRSPAADVRGLDVAAGIGVAGVAVPALVAFDEARGVVVTELEPGESLFNAMWNASSRWSLGRRSATDWAAVLARLAAWLAAFHETAFVGEGSGPGDLDTCIDWLRGSFRSKLETVAASPASPLSSEEVDRLRAHVDGGLRMELWRDQPIAYLHGDFAAANQLVRDDGSLCVLDFGDSRVGFALEDVVRLWSGVWELAECGRRRRALFHPALERILTVCGLSSTMRRTPPFELLRTWNAVTQLCVACGSRTRYGLSTRWIHRRLTAAQLRWLRRTVLV